MRNDKTRICPECGTEAHKAQSSCPRCGRRVISVDLLLLEEQRSRDVKQRQEQYGKDWRLFK